MKPLKAAIVGATGTVGLRLVSLLKDHPWFSPVALLASKDSAGQKYGDLMQKKGLPAPEYAKDMPVLDASAPEALRGRADLVFCAVRLPPERARALEEAYARCELPVISNNSACRLLPDVPAVIPELNPGHLSAIPAQRKRLGTKRGFIAAKCNCSLQSYVPLLTPLLRYGLRRVHVCTYQAVSGAGKTLSSMPEIADNLIPFIPGEEEKSELEPLKLWGQVKDGQIVPAAGPKISAVCVRVPVSDGHTAVVFADFDRPPKREEVLSAWQNYPYRRGLPSAPEKFIHVFSEPDRPQPKLDRDLEGGMAISVGRLKEDGDGIRFIGLSHNTVRGAAGGAILLAELLASKGYLE